MKHSTIFHRRKFIAGALLGAAGTLEAGTLLSALFADSRPRTALPGTGPEDTFHVIPHNHWEGAVFATREAYLTMGLPHIVTALKLLGQYPEYRFTLDQVNYIRPFLERYEEEGKAFRRFVQEGRLEIVGGTDTMHDTNIPSGESIVRQLLYGKRYLRKELGVDVRTGWGIDTFGHSAQMPQILQAAGLQSLWFVRGVPNREMPAEFFWEGLDGTRIPAFWLPYSYVIMARVPGEAREFDAFVRRKFESLTPFVRGGKDRVGLAGWDVENPQEILPPMMRQFSAAADAPFQLRFSTPSDYEKKIALRNDLTTFRGEFNPIFQGVYSSRIELKQRLRSVERMLTTAEKLGVLNELTGQAIEDRELWSAWEPTLFNQAHDLMSGVMTDHVYADTIRGYDYSQQTGEELVEKRLDAFTAQIRIRDGVTSLVIYNPLGWERTDVVEANLAFARGGVADLTVSDPAGAAQPVELLHAERYEDGSLREVRVIFLAKAIPSMGYKVYTVQPLAEASPLHTARPAGLKEHEIGNELYTIGFDLYSGAMKSLLVHADKWEVLSDAGNVVSRQYDGGDFWELYQNLRDGIVAKTTRQPVPTDFKERLSREGRYRGEKGTIHNGPVYSEFSVAHPFGTQNSFATRVRIYAGIRRIDIQTRIYNVEKYVRYQVQFPTTITGGETVHEIPFGAIQRPEAVEYPAQNWADYSDGKKGLTVLNKGLPGNLTSGSTMLLSLLRSARIEDYGYQGGYEPWMTSDTGLQTNKTLVFDYGLVPHAGDWKQAQVFRDGQEFINPLICHKPAASKGRLGTTWGLVTVSHPNVLLSSLKPGPDGSVILRVYEATGAATAGVSLSFSTSVRSAYEANLLEDKGRELRPVKNRVAFDLRPFEIKTLRLQLKKI